ncbi:PAS domain-containing sensor histidine kinase [Desulfopila sp. IMCC35008]|uniref:PAS domain-containing hybrid sensor histidine kinase/response regulator n=1 Tax=Desulfopila sp. IMCC35008 TaxID=2653858 RepID=UPI0013D1FFEA|nr:PAS domain-containing sensor histidine kinase [Desulfopila sp. IMCC35008]
MTRDKTKSNSRPILSSIPTLRKQAEERLLHLETLQQSKTLDSAETRRLIHELNVHQIELEMQNEELQRTYLELDELQARYFDLYNLAPVGYCTVGEKGLIQEANFTAANLLGVNPSNLIKQSFFRFIQNDDQDIYYLFKKRLFETSKAQTCEVRLICQDGTSFWAELEATISLDEHGKAESRVVLSDISKRKRDADELKEMHRQNQEILNSITDGFISFTDDMVVSYFNTAAERILGEKRTDVIGQNLFTSFPTIQGSLIEEKYTEAIRTQSAISFQVEVATSPYKNWYDVRIYPGHNVTTVYFQVITDQKIIEDEKMKQESVNRQLQKAESLGRMAAAIAHHFNNKLHAVMGFLELSSDSLPSGNEAIPLLTMARQEATQASEVSKLMLTYLGHVTGKKEPLELSKVCREILPLIEVTLPRNVVLKTDLLLPSPVIKGNADDIRQIVTNLLENAAEAAGDKPGSIHLSVKTVSSVNIPPSSSRFPADWQPDNTRYACLEIADQGCGVATHDIEEIFSPFFTTKFTGRGLGLSVALGLVKAHDGAITVESVQGKGSIFQIFLPIFAEKIVHQPNYNLNSEKIQAGGTILLVDDDRIVLEITDEMLSIIGFRVLKAASGVEAVEIFLEHKDEIRFVLSDVLMPRMNGWELLLALRQIMPAVPVILASGYSKEQVMEGVKHAERPQAFLGKPYSFQELKDTVQHILSAEKKISSKNISRIEKIVSR